MSKYTNPIYRKCRCCMNYSNPMYRKCRNCTNPIYRKCRSCMNYTNPTLICTQNLGLVCTTPILHFFHTDNLCFGPVCTLSDGLSRSRPQRLPVNEGDLVRSFVLRVPSIVPTADESTLSARGTALAILC